MEQDFSSKEYKYGFQTKIDSEKFKKGLNQQVIEKISSIKNEPKFLKDFRLKAYKK